MEVSKKQPKDQDSTNKPGVKECKSTANDLLKYAGNFHLFFSSPSRVNRYFRENLLQIPLYSLQLFQ
jgi:hypothetical protein